jgi:hypothetical protein
MNDTRAERPCRALQDLVAAFQGDRWQEHAVGQILEAVQVAADPDLPLDRVVVRRDVLVVDGPVLAGAFKRAALEVSLAQPKRDRIPQHGLAADPATPLRVEPGLAGSHRRNLTGGEVERHRMRVEVRARVHARTALDNSHPDTAARKVRGEDASGGTRPDDDNVEDVVLHARPDDSLSEEDWRQPGLPSILRRGASWADHGSR